MTTDPQDRRGPRQDHEPADDELDPGQTVSPLSDFRTDIQISEIEAEQAEVAHGAVLRNSSWMAAGSIISRITGIARDIALVAALGQYVVADLFQIGNSLPDIVYVLILGGALNAVFVPQLVRRMKDDRDQGQAYTDSLLSLTGVLLVILTVVAVLAAPFIVGLYATDEYSAQQTDLAVAFARLCLPQIFFFGLYTMLAQVLNARGHFAMPMFAPIFNNIVAVITYSVFAFVVAPEVVAGGDLSTPAILWLGIGTTLGIVAQSVVLIPVLRRVGYRFHFTRRWRGMGMRKAGRLAGWTIGLVAVTQIGVIVATRLTTAANVNAAEAGLPETGFFAFTKAYLIFMIPHGIITVSIVTAQLPGLSRMVHDRRSHQAGAEIGRTMRLVSASIVPLALTLFLCSQPLSGLLFDIGANSAEQASELGVTIGLFMLGLLPFTLYYVLQRGWYAREDTRTPFLFACLMNVVYVICALWWFPMAPPGGPQVYMVTLAFGAANWVMFIVAWPTLSRQYTFLDSMSTIWTLARILFAAGVALGCMALVLWWLNGGYQVGDSKLIAIGYLALTTAVVFAVYLPMAWLVRVQEVRDVLRWVGRALRAAVRR